MSEESATQDELAPERVAEIARSGEGQLIDVRNPHEWEAGRIGGAIHIELAEVSRRAGEIGRDQPVVFYCRGGNRSAMAAQAFREAGFDAHNMSGGLQAWADQGLPLEPDGGYVAESGEAAAVLEARRRDAQG